MFAVQNELVAHSEHGVDAFKQGRIQDDVIAVCGKFGRDGLGSFANDVIGVGAIDREKRTPDSGECAATDLERNDRVFESRGIGICDDCIDFRPLLLHASTQGGQVVSGFDEIERRHAEGGIPVGEERVLTFDSGHGFRLRVSGRRRLGVAAGGQYKARSRQYKLLIFHLFFQYSRFAKVIR